jgi:hypothetical protein
METSSGWLYRCSSFPPVPDVRHMHTDSYFQMRADGRQASAWVNMALSIKVRPLKVKTIIRTSSLFFDCGKVCRKGTRGPKSSQFGPLETRFDGTQVGTSAP